MKPPDLMTIAEAREWWTKKTAPVAARILQITDGVRARLPHLTPAEVQIIDDDLRGIIADLDASFERWLTNRGGDE